MKFRGPSFPLRRYAAAAAVLLLSLAAACWTAAHLRPAVSGWRLTPRAAARTEESLPQTAVEGRVNVNNAGAEELCTVKGIGPKLAEKILEERERNGPFRYWEDLLCVNGIGEKTLRKLEGQLGLN